MEIFERRFSIFGTRVLGSFAFLFFLLASFQAGGRGASAFSLARVLVISFGLGGSGVHCGCFTILRDKDVCELSLG